MKECIPPEKIGIYEINCKDCEKIYIGKRQWDLETMVKEHFRNIKIERSLVAANVWKEISTMDCKSVILKPIKQTRIIKLGKYPYN